MRFADVVLGQCYCCSGLLTCHLFHSLVECLLVYLASEELPTQVLCCCHVPSMAVSVATMRKQEGILLVIVQDPQLARWCEHRIGPGLFSVATKSFTPHAQAVHVCNYSVAILVMGMARDMRRDDDCKALTLILFRSGAHSQWYTGITLIIILFQPNRSN